jgi:hypothetical protein
MKQFAILCIKGNKAVPIPDPVMSVDLFKYCYKLMQHFDQIKGYQVYKVSDDDDAFMQKVEMIDEIITMRSKLGIVTSQEQMNYYFTYDWAALRLVHETLKEEISQ